MKTPATLFFSLFFFTASAKTWQVGAGKTYTKPSAVASLVQNGDTVAIDAGTYVGDVANWTKNNLVLKGVGGLAHLNANNTAYGRKGIWLITGTNTTVENIEFSHCHDVDGLDLNWAGIRMQGTDLTVKNCYFHDNDNGILGGGSTSNSNVVISYTEFNHNGYGDGYSHNLYISNIDSLIFTHNYSHHASIGQELKSRAYVNYILYNRIMNESTGDASREIDLPNGGTAIIMGNLIEQGTNASNSNLIGFGVEGMINPSAHEVYLINNTIVNDRSAGSFVQLASGTAKFKAYNNIFAGPGSLLSGTATVIDTMKNWRVSSVANTGLVNAAGYDYHLLSTSAAINKGTAAGIAANGYGLTPLFEYKHPSNKSGRASVGPIDIGAYEYGNLTGLESIPSSSVEFYVYTDAYDNSVNLFFTNLQADKDVAIYDMTGKLVAKRERMASSKISFDRSAFGPGIYVARVKVGESVVTKKFVIQ